MTTICLNGVPDFRSELHTRTFTDSPLLYIQMGKLDPASEVTKLAQGFSEVGLLLA